eukprot:6570647-Alexandrium_andersonii.AAC.1
MLSTERAVCTHCLPLVRCVFRAMFARLALLRVPFASVGGRRWGAADSVAQAEEWMGGLRA